MSKPRPPEVVELLHLIAEIFRAQKEETGRFSPIHIPYGEVK